MVLLGLHVVVGATQAAGLVSGGLALVLAVLAVFAVVVLAQCVVEKVIFNFGDEGERGRGGEGRGIVDEIGSDATVKLAVANRWTGLRRTRSARSTGASSRSTGGALWACQRSCV